MAAGKSAPADKGPSGKADKGAANEQHHNDGGAAAARELVPSSCKPVQLDVTLRHMHHRSVYRRFYGAYDPARPGLSMALIMLLLIACLLTAVYWTKTGPVVSWRVRCCWCCCWCCCCWW